MNFVDTCNNLFWLKYGDSFDKVCAYPFGIVSLGPGGGRGPATARCGVQKLCRAMQGPVR